MNIAIIVIRRIFISLFYVNENNSDFNLIQAKALRRYMIHIYAIQWHYLSKDPISMNCTNQYRSRGFGWVILLVCEMKTEINNGKRCKFFQKVKRSDSDHCFTDLYVDSDCPLPMVHKMFISFDDMLCYASVDL